VLSQLWSDCKATHAIEWMIKHVCLLASANYGNYNEHRLYNQNQETKICFAILLVCCVSLFQHKISTLNRKQTENSKIALESKLALGM